MGRQSQPRLAVPPDKPYSIVKGFTAETLPGLFLERCRRTPNKAAFRAKELGIYREFSWSEYFDQVERLCLGLVELGLKKGDRIAIMGGSFYQWLYAEMAAQCAGAITYGIYHTSSVPQVKHHLADGGARFFVAENQEYVDKVLAIADELPNLEYIAVADTTAMFMYDDPRIISLEEVQNTGARVRERSPQLLEELASRVKPEDVYTLFYSAGTTGMPKAVMQTHHTLLWGALNSCEVEPFLIDETVRAASYMPLAHGVGRVWDIYVPILGGYIMNFGESAHTMQETLFDISPGIFNGTPRTYEKLAAQILVGIETSSWIKKVAYRAAMAVGRRYIRQRWQGSVSLYLAVLYRVAHWTVFRPILDKLGLARVKIAQVTGAAVPRAVVALWQVWGVNLREIYGSAEAQCLTWPLTEFPRPGDAGPPAPRQEVRLTDEGELIARGPNCLIGYWQDETATARVLRDGWVHTGDAVSITEDGAMKVLGRMGDVQITAGGKNITPEEVEKEIKASPYISEAIVFAGGRKYPSALIEIDFDTVSEWARANGIVYTTFTDLTAHPKVYELISGEVEKGNKLLARVEQAKKFRIIPKELDPEDETDPITATRKIQRNRVYEKFRDLVESMYTREEESKIAAEVAELREELGVDTR